MKNIFIALLTILALSIFTACNSFDLVKGSQSPNYMARKLNSPAVIVFESRTCSTCREIKPVLKKVAQEYQSNVQFIHYDLDNINDEEAQSTAEQFKIFVVPTLYFVNQKGFVQHHTYGRITEQKLKKIIDDKLLHHTP